MCFKLDKLALENEYFRRVIYTTKHQQLVIMSVKDKIPLEVHPKNDQFLKIVKGKCQVQLGSDFYELEEGDSVTVPAGTKHEVKNIIDEPIKLYTIYSPPHHPDGLVEK